MQGGKMKKLLNFIKKLFGGGNTSPAPQRPVEPVITPPIKEKPIDFEFGEFDFIILDRVVPVLEKVCNTILRNLARYEYVEALTGVPWRVIAACHYRESSLNFKGVLHNGEYIIGTGKKTKLVPAGRGPFTSWEQAAVDAMMIEKSKFPRTWDIKGQLDFCERFNGLGYRNKGAPSPYVYAGTDKYKSGLYVADGKYSSTKVDMRLGCAAIIKGLSK